jgi:hypothetical protein
LAELYERINNIVKDGLNRMAQFDEQRAKDEQMLNDAL